MDNPFNGLALSDLVVIGLVVVTMIILIVTHAFGSRTRSTDSAAKRYGHVDAVVLIGLIVVVGILFYAGAGIVHNLVASILDVPTGKVLACHSTWTAMGFAYDIVAGAMFAAIALFLIGIDEIVASFFMPRQRIKLLASGILVSIAIVLALGVFVLLAHILGQPLVTLPAC